MRDRYKLPSESDHLPPGVRQKDIDGRDEREPDEQGYNPDDAVDEELFHM